MIRDIIVALAAGSPGKCTERYAISLAKLFNAHLVGIAFDYTAEPSHGFDIAAEALRQWHTEKTIAADAAVLSFKEAAQKAGISADARKLTTNYVEAGDIFCKIARRFDISVVGQGERRKIDTKRLIIEAALFSSGRPLIMVPYDYSVSFKLNRITICWDGSAVAARAIADAMPLLHQATAIDLLTVTGELPKSEESGFADMAQHLARHGLPVSATQIAQGGESSTISAILSFATDASTDLLISGGYGHSRTREFILGGVTLGMRDAAKIPVLMSH
jgi:nucleotide-binding universal stress UspA family protein